MILSNSWDIGYVCDVTSFEMASDSDREITKINGYHNSGKSNDDVEYFYSDEVLPIMPTNLAAKFKNLKLVCFNKCNISAITKDIMQPFGDKLQEVFFQRSQMLELIEADAFDSNPNLKTISFKRSGIKYVGNGAFDKLHNLQTLHFDDTKCQIENADDRFQVLSLIEKIKRNCLKPDDTTLAPVETTTYHASFAAATSAIEPSIVSVMMMLVFRFL